MYRVLLLILGLVTACSRDGAAKHAPEAAPPIATDVGVAEVVAQVDVAQVDVAPAVVKPRPPRVGSEAIVWYTTKAGATESAWIRETAEGYDVLATRPEVVLVDQGRLYADRVVEDASCCGRPRVPLLVFARFGPLGDAAAETHLVGDRRAAETRYDEMPELKGAIGPIAQRRARGAKGPDLLPFDVTTLDLPTLEAALEQLRAEVGGASAEDGPFVDPHVAPTRGVVLALRERAAGTSFGFGSIIVAPEMRDALLAAFADVTTLPVMLPSAAQLSRLRESSMQAKNGELTKAIAGFDAILGEAPELGRAWLGRGYTRHKAQDFDGARDDYTKALELLREPELKADAHLGLAQLEERARATWRAVDHYQRAASLERDSGAQERLDAIGMTAIRFFGDAPVQFVISGFPAISNDGTQVATVTSHSLGMSDYVTVTLQIWSTADGSELFKQEVYTTVDDNGSMEDRPRTAKRRRAAKAISEQLGAKKWRHIEEGIEHDMDNDLPIPTAKGEVVVRYTHSTLEVDVRGAANTWSKSLPMSVRDVRDGFNCSMNDYLWAAATDIEHRVMVLAFDYDARNSSDLCGFHPPTTIVVPIPNAATADWTERPRARAPRWLETLREQLPGADGGSALEPEARKQLEGFLAIWGARYPNAPIIKTLRTRLAAP